MSRLHGADMRTVLAVLCLGFALVLCQKTCGYNNVTDALGVLEESKLLMYIRPVMDWTEPTYVEVDVIFRAVLDMDEKLQSLSTLMDFEMIWHSQFLSWDPEAFCGISRVPIPENLLWIPDINIAEMTEDNSVETTYLLLYHNGKIQRTKVLNVMTKCSLDLYKFPFDSQKCNLTFGVRANPVTDVIMTNATSASRVTFLSMKDFSSGEWSLQSVDIFPINVSSQGDVWSKVIYQISIRRAPILYVINLIIPACLLVFVDVASMFIPMEGGERLGFKITVVLGFSVLLLILNDFLPNSDQPPILGVFCMVCLLIMIISIMDSIFISYMLYLSAIRPDVPTWLKVWILKHLARVLRIDTFEGTPASAIDGFRNKAVDDQNKGVSPGVILASDLPELPIQAKKNLAKEIKDSTENKLLKRILTELLVIRRHLFSTKKEEEARSQWHLVAFVLDRFILILYLFIVSIIIVVVIIVWIT